MGSSKKHKERDKDRDHKRKRRHRSRSRERSKSKERKRPRSEHSEKSEKKHEKRRKDKRYSPDDFDGPPVKSEDRPPVYKTEADDIGASVGALHDLKEPVRYSSGDIPGPPPPVPSSSGGGDLVLTIEETNKMRAKLGLKPLDVGEPEVKEEKESLKDDIHVPAVNMAEKRRSEALREKMLQIREKRRINVKLGKVKNLGDSESEDEGVTAWVTKSRKIQREKEMADKRAKVLEEMDQEFGIGNLMEEEFSANRKKGYSSKDLRGLAVEHGQDSFKEGQTVILTLKDQGVLEEAGDALINVNMLDAERADKNVENKKKKPDYNPYDEPFIDEYGMMQEKDVLEKYNEEIHGAKQSRFELGAGGKYNAEHERRMQQYKQELRQKGESLTLAAPKIASEFLSHEEMATFKKVKKKVRKIRKKPKAVKADDLIALGDDISDVGRRRRPKRPGEVDEPIDPEVMPKEDMAIPGLDLVPNSSDITADTDSMDMEVDIPDFDEPEILGPEEDLTGVTVEDDAGLELELALNKARKLKRKQNSAPEQILVAKIKEKEEEMEEESLASSGGKGINITLNSTSEFCRTLGDIPTYGQAGNREEDKDELLDFERELMEERKRQREEEEANTGWQTVDIDTRPVDIGNEEHTALDEEPVVDSGIAAALALAKKKGYLEKEEYKISAHAPSHSTLLAQNYSIEDKRYDDLDEKYRKRDRYMGGITQDFKELDTYKPDVKLEYVDETGRALNEKEAFRQLSHRFHGKGSGKKKTEKRSKKIQEENLMKQMSSTDTPLGTLNLLQEKQKAEKSPFVILSGGKGSLSSASITKLAP